MPRVTRNSAATSRVAARTEREDVQCVHARDTGEPGRQLARELDAATATDLRAGGLGIVTPGSAQARSAMRSLRSNATLA